MKPKTRKPAVKDPVFDLIAEYKALSKKMFHLYSKLDAAEFRADETHGKRPKNWIWWRRYDVFDKNHADTRRKQFLQIPGANRKQIEKEYIDAKARLTGAMNERAAWEERAGIAPLREQYECACEAEEKALMRIARTKPTTLAGVIALLDYTRRDMEAGYTPWTIGAIKTVSIALSRMNAEGARR